MTTKNPRYYLTVNLPPNFDEVDAEMIKKDLLAYIVSRNQYGAMYGPKASKKGITIDKVLYRTNED